jgi:hypothetical protein
LIQSSKFIYLGLLGILAAGATQAATINVSTGTAAYNITADTNGGTDAGYTGAAIDITSLPAAPFTHLSGPLSDGTDTGVWVGPNASESTEPGTVSGSTTYVVTFSLAGLDPTTASLIMSLAADDFVSSVVLNSTTIFTPTNGEMTNGMWTTAATLPTITSGFLAGTNTLTFIVPNSSSDNTSNCCGPTGLIVAADVFASPSSVPEPSTVATSGLCLMGLLVVARRRQLAKAR